MKKLMLTVVACAAAFGAFAEGFDEHIERHWMPLEIDLYSPLKVWPYDRDVYGLRASILYGRSENIYGIDCGLIGVNRGNVAGLQANGFNLVNGASYGLQVGAVGSYVTGNFFGGQFNGLLSWNQSESYGIQVAALNFNSAFTGLQAGVLNWNRDETYGIMLGAINVEHHDIEGAMIGALNYFGGKTHNISGGQIGVINTIAGAGHGFQFGLINAAQRFVGVQIGLINLNEMGTLPIMAIANANF